MSIASLPPRMRTSRTPGPEISGGVALSAVRSCVRGVGAALPARVVPNAELTSMVDTTDEWIRQRTGIRQRFVAGKGETTSTLATKAAEAALRSAGLGAADVDLILVATSTPDYTFPAVATQVQANLGIVEGAAFDLQAVCTGFVYAVATADKFLRSGSHMRALVIGAETFSRILDWSDRATCVLFGDGAGAIVLEARASDGALASPGVIASRLRADGRHRTKLFVDGGPSSTGTVGHLRMEGKEVFRHAVGMVTDVIQGCLTDAGATADAIDWFVPHQANRRIIDATALKLGIPAHKVVVTVDAHGNTSAASVPLALDVAVRDGPHQAGRSGDDRGDGRRLHLGRGADPLVGSRAGAELSAGERKTGGPMSSLNRAIVVALTTFGASVIGMLLQWVVPAQVLTAPRARSARWSGSSRSCWRSSSVSSCSPPSRCSRRSSPKRNRWAR